jgi:pseudouridine synthase
MIPLRKKGISNPPGTERLERYLAQSGMCSRREAKDLIARGLVTVKGKTVRSPGAALELPGDIVKLKDTKLKEVAKESLLLYKPRGIETSATSLGAVDIHTKFPRLAHLNPIGRLDKDSEGLIIMSNDGTLARALTQEDSTVEKEYLVTTREFVPAPAIERMQRGIMLDRVKTKPADVVGKTRTSFYITLREGRKHQIRRMCDACKLTIVSLQRVRIGHMTIGKMEPGNVKKLLPQDIEKLKAK